MTFSRVKKTLAALVLISVVSLLVMNYRIPFFKNDIGDWSVGFGWSDQFPEKIEVNPKNIYGISKLKMDSPNSKFLADPFLVYEENNYYIFFEHKTLDRHPAQISVLVSSDGKNYRYDGPVVCEKFHLSYPQVFKYRGEFYMLPESQGANNVLLYKATQFPYRWKICDTLIANVKLKDPSIYLSDTLNIMAVTDRNMNMFMYRADSLFGKWILHSRPKILMGNESRSGGRFFNDGHGLLLPVQENRESYGSGLSLYRLKFKNGNYTVRREKHRFLKARPKIPEFAGGMHQFDIQVINGKYYYVFDGVSLKSKDQNLQMYKTVKANLYDLKNWCYQLLYN